MKLRPEQLNYHLAKTLAPCYLVAGDEQLLVNEACTAIRLAATTAGYSERLRYFVDSGFNWSAFQSSIQNFPLFAEQQLLELSLDNGKLDEEGRETLAAYLKKPAPDKLLLIRSPKLDASTAKAAWYKTFEEVGVVVVIYPLTREQLPNWIKQRLLQAGIKATQEMAELLTEKVEGNLLAAGQEIEKLKLLVGEGELDLETLLAAVGDSSRFDVYQLIDTAMRGEAAKAMHILDHLQAEGLEAPIVLWALAREIRALAGIKLAMDKGQNIGSAISSTGVWEKRKPLVQMSLQRKPLIHWSLLLRKAAAIDLSIKGVGPGSSWDGLRELTLNLAGVNLIP